MATGWTWPQARALSYCDYLTLKRYWSEVAPPLCLTMAAFAGFKPRAPQIAASEQPASAQEVFGALHLNPDAPMREVKRETRTINF